MQLHVSCHASAESSSQFRLHRGCRGGAVPQEGEVLEYLVPELRCDGPMVIHLNREESRKRVARVDCVGVSVRGLLGREIGQAMQRVSKRKKSTLPPSTFAKVHFFPSQTPKPGKTLPSIFKTVHRFESGFVFFFFYLFRLNL